MARPRTIDEYLDGFTGQARELLDRLRALAGEAVPEAEVAIKSMPTSPGSPPARAGSSSRTASGCRTTCCAG
jgi:hypothetical protein